MAHSPTLVRTMRKLLRFGATTRTTRIVKKLSSEELAALVTALPRAESWQLIDIFLSTPESGEKLKRIPENCHALDHALAALPDARLGGYIATQSADVSAILLQRLPKPRRADIRCGLSPELIRSIDRHLPLGQKLGARRAQEVTSFTGRIASLFSMIF
jgi:hypothetical protein